MKSLFIFLVMLISVVSHAQNFDVMDWNMDGDVNDGLQIRTRIPVDNNLHFPSVTIEGYDHGRSSSISLKVSWTLENGNFSNATVSSSGGLAPDVVLSQSNGYIQIYLKMWGSKTRLHITAFAMGAQETASWFTNWSIAVDETFDGQNIKQALYYNEFKGDVKFETINTESAAISKATVGELSVDHVRGNLTVFGPMPVDDVDPQPQPPGEVFLNGQDGGINIISGNDNHSYIDFRGLAHLNNTQGRILHSDDIGFKFYTAGDLNNSKMVINNNGVVGIGNTTGLASGTDPYKLYVEGGVRTRKLKVDAPTTAWPDYVFEPEYELRTLSSLEAFIKANKHLPDVPSADEVNKDGMDVGEVQVMLLKKIEELTLYVIEQDKKQELLTKRLEEQRQLLLQLKKKIKE